MFLKWLKLLLLKNIIFFNGIFSDNIDEVEYSDDFEALVYLDPTILKCAIKISRINKDYRSYISFTKALSDRAKGKLIEKQIIKKLFLLSDFPSVDGDFLHILREKVLEKLCFDYPIYFKSEEYIDMPFLEYYYENSSVENSFYTLNINDVDSVELKQKRLIRSRKYSTSEKEINLSNYLEGVFGCSEDELAVFFSYVRYRDLSQNKPYKIKNNLLENFESKIRKILIERGIDDSLLDYLKDSKKVSLAYKSKVADKLFNEEPSYYDDDEPYLVVNSDTLIKTSFNLRNNQLLFIKPSSSRSRFENLESCIYLGKSKRQSKKFYINSYEYSLNDNKKSKAIYYKSNSSYFCYQLGKTSSVSRDLFFERSKKAKLLSYREYKKYKSPTKIRRKKRIKGSRLKKYNILSFFTGVFFILSLSSLFNIYFEPETQLNLSPFDVIKKATRSIQTGFYNSENHCYEHTAIRLLHELFYRQDEETGKFSERVNSKGVKIIKILEEIDSKCEISKNSSNSVETSGKALFSMISDVRTNYFTSMKYIEGEGMVGAREKFLGSLAIAESKLTEAVQKKEDSIFYYNGGQDSANQIIDKLFTLCDKYIFFKFLYSEQASKYQIFFNLKIPDKTKEEEEISLNQMITKYQKKEQLVRNKYRLPSKALREYLFNKELAKIYKNKSLLELLLSRYSKTKEYNSKIKIRRIELRKEYKDNRLNLTMLNVYNFMLDEFINNNRIRKEEKQKIIKALARVSNSFKEKDKFEEDYLYAIETNEHKLDVFKVCTTVEKYERAIKVYPINEVLPMTKYSYDGDKKSKTLFRNIRTPVELKGQKLPFHNDSNSYNLKIFAHHSGGSVEYGHHFVYQNLLYKDKDNKTCDKWFKISDREFSEISETEAKRLAAAPEVAAYIFEKSKI